MRVLRCNLQLYLPRAYKHMSLKPLYVYLTSCLPERAPLKSPFSSAWIPYSDQNQKCRSTQEAGESLGLLREKLTRVAPMSESQVECLIIRNEHWWYFHLLGIFPNSIDSLWRRQYFSSLLSVGRVRKQAVKRSQLTKAAGGIWNTSPSLVNVVPGIFQIGSGFSTNLERMLGPMWPTWWERHTFVSV